MASLNLTFDASDMGAIDRAIAALQNLQPKLAEVGEYLVFKTRLRFDRQTDPDGKPWDPLSLDYERRKRANSRALPDILTYTGALRDTITYQVEGETLKVGSPMAYAAYHQFGTAKMPQRAFLGVDNEDLEEIRAILLGDLGDG